MQRNLTTKFALVTALALIALVAPSALSANAIGTQFNVSGTFADGSVLSGTLTIDTTTGTPISVSLETAGPTSVGPLTDLGYSGDQPQFFEVAAQGFNNDDIYLFFDAPNLIGYTGGALCGLSTGCVSTMGPLQNQGPVYSYATDPIYLKYGSVTLPATTPEPSSLLLLGTGLLGGIGVLRRRLSK